MTIRNGLPFEFPFRWNDLRRFVSGLKEGEEAADEAVDFLDQRDRDLEDFLAGLGGIDEAFVADAVGTSTTSITAANTSSAIQFRVSSANIGRFQTTGVSDLSSAVTSVTLPAGLWDLQAQIRLSTSGTAPSSGYYDVMFDYENEYVRVPWSQVTDPGSGGYTATVWLHRRYYLTTASAIGFTIFNESDQSITASCRMFSGVQLAKYGDLNT